MDVLITFLGQLLAFVPVVAVAAPLISIVVEAIKSAGWLPDGYGGVLSGLLNLAAWIAMAIVGHFGFVEEATTIIAALTQIAPIIVAVLGSAFVSNLFFKVARWAGLPLFNQA